MMQFHASASQEWEQALRGIVTSARKLVLDAQAVSILAQTNDISAIIDETAPGEMLAGTSITREDAQLRAAAFADMLQWLSEDATGAPAGTSRLSIIFRRF